MVAKAIRDQLFSLPPEERLLLAEDLWKSLVDEESVLLLSEEHRQILEERLREFEEHPDNALSWDEVKVDAQRAFAEHRRQRSTGEARASHELSDRVSTARSDRP